MADLDFSGVLAKFAWANVHFQRVDAEIATWLKDDAHRVIYERNEDFTQHYLRAEFGSQPRTEWPLMIGDCVTNLRDTLDHAIYALAHIPGRSIPPKAEKAAFVITQTRQAFDDAAKGKLVGVSEKVRDTVLDFQPFNRPHNILPPLLSILNELANGTKHKLLNVVLTVPQDLDVLFTSRRRSHGRPAQVGINRTGIVEGAPFLVFETPDPDPDCKLANAHVAFGMAIAHSPLPGDVTYDAGHTTYRVLLQALFDEVEHIRDSLIALA